MASKDLAKRSNQYPTGQGQANERSVRPPVDIFENDHEYLLLADLPGVDPSTLEVELDAEQLRIRGRRPGNGNAALVYQRVFTLGAGLDPNGVSAKLENGVLHISAKKSEAVRPRRISVSGS